MLPKNTLKNFTWYGININGFKVKGKIKSPNRESAKKELMQRQITILKIRPYFEITLFYLNRKINNKDINEMSVEFATLISANIPLIAVFNILIESTKKPAMNQLLVHLKKQIENGTSLTEAFKTYSVYFDSLFCNLIYVGEHSGELENILKYITDYRQKIQVLKNKTKKALFYPCFVLVIACIVTYTMLIFIIPQFARLFQTAGAELPLLTQLVISIANFFIKYGALVFLIPVIIIIILKIALKYVSSWQKIIDYLLIKIPFIGKIITAIIFARSFRTLATTLQAGLPLLDALQLTANVALNHIYYQSWLQIIDHIKNGKTFNHALQTTTLFPSRVIQMIAIGESSGCLENMLQKLGEYFEEKVASQIQNLSQLLEPILMLFLCVLIGTLVIAMYLPIFKIGTVI